MSPNHIKIKIKRPKTPKARFSSIWDTILASIFMKFRDGPNLMFCNKTKEITTFTLSWPLNFASHFLLNFKFFLEPLLNLLFLVFFQHDAQKLDFWTPFKIHWAPKWRPKSHLSAKLASETFSRAQPFPFVEPTGAPWAARSAPDPIFIDL